LLLIGSKARSLTVNGRDYPIYEWSEHLVDKFEPDVVLDFAFLTRDFVGSVGRTKFVQVNTELQNRVLALTKRQSVKGLLTISSGAALSEGSHENPMKSSDPYGAMKHGFEKQLDQARSQIDTFIVIARAWSLSGGFVGESESLALSSFARAALESGQITIKADTLVYRRYCAVEDFLAVALWGLMGEKFQSIDSGGDLVEMKDLALVVSRLAGNTTVKEEFSNRTQNPARAYCSDNLTWSKYSLDSGLSPLSLAQQVRNVLSATRSWAQERPLA
jgi:nucleoside-diphosphate-sugar epimerase